MFLENMENDEVKECVEREGKEHLQSWRFNYYLHSVCVHVLPMV